MQHDHHQAQSQAASAPKTKEVLDAVRHKLTSNQLTPDVKYGLILGDRRWNAYAYGDGQSPGVNLDTEYWAIDEAFLNAINEASAGAILTFAPSSPVGTVMSAPLTNPLTSTWNLLPNNSFSGRVFVSDDRTMGVAFVLTPGQPGQPWTGDLWWFSSIAPSSPLIPGIKTTDLSLNTRELPASSSGSWYYLKLPALVWPSGNVEVSCNARLGAAMTAMTVSRQDTLFLADIKKSNRRLYVHQSTDGASWTETKNFDVNAAGAPGIAALDGTLYLVYARKKNGDIDQMTSTDGSKWSKSSSTGASTSGSPTLATVNGVLTMAYQSGSDEKHIHTRPWDPNKKRWSPFSEAPITSAKKSPAFGAFERCSLSRSPIRRRRSALQSYCRVDGEHYLAGQPATRRHHSISLRRHLDLGQPNQLGRPADAEPEGR